MQQPFSCTNITFASIENTLSAPRLARYLGEAKGDKHYALRLYVWNGHLCEAFYLPIQIAEVCSRNTILAALSAKHGNEWFERGAFLCTLPERLKNELSGVIRDERQAHGSALTTNHIVSGLSFGFWVHLMTKNYEGVFWPAYFQTCFPNKPKDVTRRMLHEKLERLRTFRNRIAHHKPIFDHSPKAEYQSLMETIEWICRETHWFTRQISRVDQTINAKPRN